MIKLELNKGDWKMAQELSEEKIILGRGDTATVKLDDKKSSREHTRIERTPEGYIVTDLDSTNGTYLNGKRITRATLMKDDVIRIGDTYIGIVALDVVAQQAEMQIGTPGPGEIDSVKEKIERHVSGQSAEVAVKVAIMRKLVALAPAVIVLAAVLVAVLYFANRDNSGNSGRNVVTYVQPKKDITTGTNKVKEDDEARNREEMERVQMKMALLQNEMDKLQSEVRTDIDTGYYSNAIQKIKNFRSARKDWFEDRSVDQSFSDMLTEMERIAQSDIGQIDDACRQLIGVKRFADARAMAEKVKPRFEGTPFIATVNAMISRCELALQSDAAALEAYKSQPGNNAPAVETGKPKDVPAEKTEKPSEGTPTVEKPETKEWKYAALIPTLVKMASQASSLTLGKESVTLSGVDNTGVHLTTKAGTNKVEWASAPSELIYKLCVSALHGQDSILLANYLREAGENAKADDVCYRVLQENKKNKEMVDATLASWRGLSSAPEGGYKWNGKMKIWEDRVEESNRLALAKSDEAAKFITKSIDLRSVQKKFEEAYKLYSDPLVTEASKGQIKKELTDALLTFKTKKMKQLEESAKSGGDWSALSAKKRELDEARKVALTTIYDKKIYPDEDHGRKGQPEVDKKVDVVRKIWNGNFEAAIPPAVRDAIDGIDKSNKEMLSKLGDDSGKDDLADAEKERVLANLTEQASLGIKNMAADRAERERYNYNKRVSDYNKKVFKCPAGVPATVIDQVECLNTYREMMGRKKIFLEPRLCTAAQKHTVNMSAAGQIWHEGPDGNPQSRAQKEGFPSGVGENVAMGYGGAQAVHEGWYNSSGHHRNMLSDSWNCAGIGNEGNFWTQMFGVTAVPKEVQK